MNSNLSPQNTASENKRRFTHLVIPAEIWLRTDIPLQAKALWAELYSLHDEQAGGCYASDEYLMNFMQLKRRRLYQLYKELKEKGLMEVISFDGRRTIRKAIQPSVGNTNALLPCTKVHTSSAQKCTTDMRENAHPGTPQLYMHKKEEKKDYNKEIAQQASPTQSPSALRKSAEIVFSNEKGKFENISEQDMATWKELYPFADIGLALKEMCQWILANPSKRKKLWRKFILGWLQRVNEKAQNKAAYGAISATSPTRKANQTIFNTAKSAYPQKFASIKCTQKGISHPSGLDVDWEAPTERFEQILAKMLGVRYHAH